MKKLILKFITGTINSQELKTLQELLKVSKNQHVFKNYIKDYYNINLLMLKVDTNNAYKRVLKDINEKVKPVRSIIPNLLKYAAIFIGLIGLVYFFQYNNATEDLISTPNKVTSHKTITLTLNNGENIDLEKRKEYISNKVKGNSKKLLYSSNNVSNKTNKKLVYNYLTIPRGNEYFVKLSDGTKVWLNSESKLKYPESFNKGETRIVELVYGEAYFEVTSSVNNNGDSFNVISNNQEIKVLGTHFNVKTYKEDKMTSTTLVEGKVEVNNGLYSVLLKPSQQSKVLNKTDLIKVTNVDISHEISWVKGVFSFNEKSLEDIMQILSRWYNVEYVFKSDESKNYQFTGVLERTKSIKEILIFFESISDGDLEFTIKNNKVIIK